MTVKSTCEWYALCDNPLDGFVSHPVLDWVPTCQRCADKHGMTLETYYTACLRTFETMSDDALFSEGLDSVVSPGDPTDALRDARAQRRG